MGLPKPINGQEEILLAIYDRMGEILDILRPAEDNIVSLAEPVRKRGRPTK
jgi:hypothetical protein